MFVQGLDLSNSVCEYEVNRLTNEKKLLEENETLPQIVNNAGRTSPIYYKKLSSKTPAEHVYCLL